jgi:hypothetical protein
MITLPVVQNRKAIICDLDGTLSSSGWRNHLWVENKNEWGAGIPFDRVITNTYNTIQVFSMSGVEIIYLTGRVDSHRRHTVDWLHKYNCPHGSLYMRTIGLEMKNEDYKKMIYDEYIKKDNLDIMFALDDNEKVIEMWKSIDIPTIHISESNDLIPRIFESTMLK